MRRAYARRDVAERFWEKTIPEPMSGCWLWLAAEFSTGYGKFSVQHGCTVYAHRFAYTLAHNVELTSGQYVCHRCDVRCCVNPDHLFIGDAQANVDDMLAKGRGRWNNPSGEAHPRAKLNRHDVEKIRSAVHARGVVASLAKEHGVSETTISRLRKGLGWKDCA